MLEEELAVEGDWIGGLTDKDILLCVEGRDDLVPGLLAVC